ncbi:MAG: metallophosphoesterase [Bacillus sp. (in: Bacteria)]|nr:metallophosphoesterase [Bacillus sp. (in: firmicutes)]MCM1426025.1 metallophosphoesterase [Eubacterium sp.]
MIPVILTVLVVLICFFLLVMYYDCNRFVTAEYEIESDKAAGEYTFALLADLHNKSFGEQNERLLRKIDELAPDAVLVAGDMLTARDTKGKYHVAVDLMNRLSRKYPVYYGMGNHEQHLGLYPEQAEGVYEDYIENLHSFGIEPLINESVELPSANINICGLQVERRYYRKFRTYPMPDDYLTDLLGTAQKDKFQILIAHNPDYFEDYVKWGADLVVSGHVHGGLMKLPFLGGVVSPKLTLFPKYDGGRYEKDNTVMILSRGLGSHTLPIRIFNPGELVMIHIKPAS